MIGPYHQALVGGQSGSQSGLAGAAAARLFWVRDGDYVVQAGTPQALIERERYHEQQPLSDWVAAQQGQDLENAVLATTMSIEDGPRFLYRAYLQLLRNAADAAGPAFDPFAVPTATEAGLPEQGRDSLVVRHRPDRLSVELGFDQTPGDILVSSPYMLTASAGALAAIAIPQYQDYIERS